MILLETIAKSGFSITTDGKNLLLKPSGLPSDLREQVRESKAEITRELIGSSLFGVGKVVFG